MRVKELRRSLHSLSLLTWSLEKMVRTVRTERMPTMEFLVQKVNRVRMVIPSPCERKWNRRMRRPRRGMPEMKACQFVLEDVVGMVALEDPDVLVGLAHSKTSVRAARRCHAGRVSLARPGEADMTERMDVMDGTESSGGLGMAVRMTMTKMGHPVF